MKGWSACGLLAGGWLLMVGCVANPRMDNQKIHLDSVDELEVQLDVYSDLDFPDSDIWLYIDVPSMDNDPDCALIEGLDVRLGGVWADEVEDGGFTSSTNAYTPFVFTRECQWISATWVDIPAGGDPEADTEITLTDGETELSFTVARGMSEVSLDQVLPDDGVVDPGESLVLNYGPSSDVLEIQSTFGYFMDADYTDYTEIPAEVTGHRISFQVPLAPADPPWVGVEVYTEASIPVLEADPKLLVTATRNGSSVFYFDPSLAPVEE